MLSNFILTLSILSIIAVIVLLITGISIAKSGDKLTGFEKKVLFFVAFGLCFGIILLYILSNLEYFFALF